MASSKTTLADVHLAAAKVGVKMAQDEVEAYHAMLQATDSAFQRLLAMPDFHLPVDTATYPRTNIHQPTGAENVLGVAWAHTFSAKSTNPSGLLGGKTLCLKDNICVAGVPQVNGTDMIEPWIPESDAIVVSRILEAGGEIIGTATCENMSYSPASNTASTGVVHNPYAKKYSAGGSSSGVGALVGSPDNLVSMGIGADQGGSIRIPATMCGAVGLKPTHGLVPYTGIVSSEAVMDHVGPICKTVMDVAILLEVVAGRDGLDDRAVGAQMHGEIKYSSNLETWYVKARKENEPGKVLKGTKVAILKEAIEEPSVHPKMRKKVYDSAYKLRDLGAEVEEISMPSHGRGRDIWMGIRRLGGSIALAGKATGRKQYTLTSFLDKLGPLTQEKWEKTPPSVKSTVINGGYALEKYPTLYHKCLNLAVQLSREYETLLSKYDVLITPTVSSTAPKLVDREDGIMAQWKSEQGIAVNTSQFNLVGNPAMTLPIGFLPDLSEADPNVKLPVGMQIIGPLHGEERILKIGYAYEKSFDWKRQ